MIYEAVDIWTSPSLEHYGVKGMKWGVRKHIYRTLAGVHRLNANTYRRLGNKTLASMNATAEKRQLKKAAYAEAQQRSLSKSRGLSAGSSKGLQTAGKIAKGAAIAGGVALAAYGATKGGKFLSTPQGKQMVSNAVSTAIFRAKNASRAGRQVAGNMSRVMRQNPAGRALKSLSQTNAGSMAVKAFGVASAVSTANTVRQFAQGVKKRGKITKRDTTTLALDMINPIPDNIPGLAKRNKYAY